MIKATTRFGSYDITVEAANSKHLIMGISFFSELTQKAGVCPVCKTADNLSLNHRNFDGMDFYAVQCLPCWQEYPIGNKKDDKGLYPRGPWVEIGRSRDSDDHHQDHPSQRQFAQTPRSRSASPPPRQPARRPDNRYQPPPPDDGPPDDPPDTTTDVPY